MLQVYLDYLIIPLPRSPSWRPVPNRFTRGRGMCRWWVFQCRKELQHLYEKTIDARHSLLVQLTTDTAVAAVCGSRKKAGRVAEESCIVEIYGNRASVF